MLTTTATLIAVLWICPASAQEPQAEFEARVDLVRLSVAVVHPLGQPVPELSAADFKVYDDGVPQEIVHFIRPVDAPIHVALLLDASYSLEPVWMSVQNAALTFLSQLEERDRIFLLPFSHLVLPGIWGGPDDTRLRRYLGQLHPHGGTCLFDALLIGFDELQRVEEETRRALVVLSDGADRDSFAPFEQVLTEARLANIPIFPVAMGLALRDHQLESRLDGLARDTGGLLVETATPAGLRPAYDEVLNYLKGSYVLGYYPHQEAKPGAEPDPETTASGAPRQKGEAELVWHEVRVDLRRPQLELIVRRGYYR